MSTPSTSVLPKSARATWFTYYPPAASPPWPRSIRGRINSPALPASGTRGSLTTPRRRRQRGPPSRESLVTALRPASPRLPVLPIPQTLRPQPLRPLLRLRRLPLPSPLMLRLRRQGPEGLPRQEGLLPCQEGPLPCPEGLPRRGQPGLKSYGSSPPRRPSAHQMPTELLLAVRARGLARLYAMVRSPCRLR